MARPRRCPPIDHSADRCRPQTSPTVELDADDGEESGWLSHNGLRINADMWLCDLDGAPVELTRSEFDLLLAIMQGARRVISKDTLALELRGDYAAAGGYVSDSDRRAVEVHMANLRRKLNDPVGSPSLHRDRTRGRLPAGRGPAGH